MAKQEKVQAPAPKTGKKPAKMGHMKQVASKFVGTCECGGNLVPVRVFLGLKTSGRMMRQCVGRDKKTRDAFMLNDQEVSAGTPGAVKGSIVVHEAIKACAAIYPRK